MPVRITQLPAEVLQDTEPEARVSSSLVHVAWRATDAEGRMESAPVHAAWAASDTEARVDQIPVHVPWKTAPAPLPAAEVLPYLLIPPGQGQRVRELEGHSSIPTLNFETIDLRGELKRLSAHTDIVGKLGRFRMGFPGMAMEDFVTLHTTQLTSVGRIGEGRMSFDSVELLNFVLGEVFKNGGPHAAPGTSNAPAPPLFQGFAANAYPIGDKNPRYLFGNPIDILLVVYQNELGVGQAAPDPVGWTLYAPGNDATLINPNRYLDVPGLLALRDGPFAGTHFEFKITSSEDGKRWADDQILKVLGLYTIIRPSGMLSFKSMKSPEAQSPVAMTRNDIIGIPEVSRDPVFNVVTVRFPAGAGEDDQKTRDYVFQQRESIERYKMQYKQEVEALGLRDSWGGYKMAFLLADRIFRRHAFAPPRYKIEAHLKHVDLEIGDLISLTHSLVLDYATGKLGLTAVVCEIVDKEPHYDNGRVSFEAKDTRFMSLTTPYYIAAAVDAIPDWTLATEEQQAYFMFISLAATAGSYSDGAPGNGIF